MWLTLRYLKFSTILKIIGIMLAIAVLIGGLITYYVVSNNKIAYLLLKNKANSIVESLDARISGVMPPALDRYPELNDPAIEDPDGLRGNGINVLMIDKIQVEGYIKELLTLYRDSANGKLDDYEAHAPIEMLLTMHNNESGVYPDGITLKSYLPWDSSSRSVVWNREYKGYSASAMTLKQYNHNVKISDLSGSIDKPTFKNVFQIDKARFNEFKPTVLHGYGHSAGRLADYTYLPDSLVQQNRAFVSLATEIDLPVDDGQLVAGVFGIRHNGGPGHMLNFQSLGITGLRYINKRSDRKTYVYEMPESLRTQTRKAMSKGRDLFVADKGYGLAIWLLIEDGYLPDLKLVSVISNSSATLRYVTQGHNAVYGESLTTSQVLSKIKELGQDPWVKLGVTKSQFDSVYGNTLNHVSDGYHKGNLYKFESPVEGIYANKLNGSEPPRLKRTSYETAGFTWDMMFRFEKILGKMLNLVGVNTDPTNPTDYLKEIENEFIPEATDFAGILKKIGVTGLTDKRYEMLEHAYNISGFWYYLGGQGKIVSAENYASHKSFMNSSGGGGTVPAGQTSRKAFLDLYKTKDGTSPLDKKNISNDNLVNYGKILLDCSQLTGIAYNETIRGTGERVIHNSTAQYSSNLLTTIADWDKALPGDIFVRKGHVFFYLAKNTTGKAVSLSIGETKTEKVQKTISGRWWALEAMDYGTRVGIRARNYIEPKEYLLRRFKILN